ncbi:BA75_01861T0 [Komagataella pastoris]|uniref:BA75_01861T0 n=1 Tax=Komagataella pastoris TaxID=4922 RepID=A0A1B2J5N0_PICPA|nr:BA75_01861T0 [Komagataella pastoris]
MLWTVPELKVARIGYKRAVVICGIVSSAATAMETWRDCYDQENHNINSFDCAISVLGSDAAVGYSVAHKMHSSGWIKRSEENESKALEEVVARLHSIEAFHT